MGQILVNFLESLRQEVLAWRQRSHDFFHLLEPGDAQTSSTSVKLTGFVSRLHPIQNKTLTYLVSPIIFLKLCTRRT